MHYTGLHLKIRFSDYFIENSGRHTCKWIILYSTYDLVNKHNASLSREKHLKTSGSIEISIDRVSIFFLDQSIRANNFLFSWRPKRNKQNKNKDLNYKFVNYFSGLSAKYRYFVVGGIFRIFLPLIYFCLFMETFLFNSIKTWILLKAD